MKDLTFTLHVDKKLLHALEGATEASGASNTSDSKILHKSIQQFLNFSLHSKCTCETTVSVTLKTISTNKKRNGITIRKYYSEIHYVI